MEQHRTTITGAPYHLARRLPFVAGNGSLSGRYLVAGDVATGRAPVEVREAFDAASDEHGNALYVVYSYGTPIAWSIDGAPFIVPATRYSVTTSHHQNIVRRVDAGVTV